jgi:hypothetical protein
MPGIEAGGVVSKSHAPSDPPTPPANHFRLFSIRIHLPRDPEQVLRNHFAEQPVVQVAVRVNKIHNFCREI